MSGGQSQGKGRGCGFPELPDHPGDIGQTLAHLISDLLSPVIQWGRKSYLREKKSEAETEADSHPAQYVLTPDQVSAPGKSKNQPRRGRVRGEGRPGQVAEEGAAAWTAWALRCFQAEVFLVQVVSVAVAPQEGSC